MQQTKQPNTIEQEQNKIIEQDKLLDSLDRTNRRVIQRAIKGKRKFGYK